MSKQPSIDQKLNLNFIAEHTADPQSAETVLKNWGIWQANPKPPACNTCGQEMSEVKIERDNSTVWPCSKH